MPSFREMLADAKAQIREVTTAEADELRQRPGAVVLDVREADEFEQGAIPGAVFIPRGTLETQHRGAHPRQGHAAGRPLRRRRPLGLRGQDPPGARLHRRRVGHGRLQQVEGRGPRLVGLPQTLTPEQRNRYKRHLLLPEVGDEGQQKLLDAKVLFLGAGGLGSPAALYLAAAGVGTIGIIDMDVVDESNLQRQILHNLDRIGDRKVDSAKKTLTLLNPDVNVVTYDVRLGADNVMDILAGPDGRLGRHRRRHRQLPDPLPRERRVGEARHPGGARLDLPLRGHGHRVRPEERPDLPRHGPRAAAGRAWPRRAPRPACSACCPASSGRSRRIETIKLLLGLGDSLSGPAARLRRPRDSRSASTRSRSIPTNEITWENRDRIEVAELEGLCAPLPLAPPPA